MLRIGFVVMLLFAATRIFSQFTLQGKIEDENGTALSGVDIELSETGKIGISDEFGNFILREIQPGLYMVRISMIGFESIADSLDISGDINKIFILKPEVIMGEEIIVRATRASENTPTTFSVVQKENLVKRNLGRDMPYLLEMEPSLVFNSDAGSGIGYTGMWIRGSNAQRINVTINGIPYNDAETHDVYWVDIPDFASSVQSVQIQRGIGTSTNGGGAFGATINLETNSINRIAFGEISSSYGSFNTWKNTIQFGTGLLKNRWALEGRASAINSDGYIDRASANLKSYFLQGGFFGAKTTLKAVVFGGKEITYLAWNGTDKATMSSDRTFNSCGAIYDVNWNILGFYEDEKDNYQHYDYQLHFSQQLGSSWIFNAALHYTNTRGYWEQYYSNEFLGDFPSGVQYYGFDSIFAGGNYQYFYHDTVMYGDLIARRGNDNHFYGSTFSLLYNSSRLNITFGGALSNYSPARNYGEIIWAEYAGNSHIRDPFYDGQSKKRDFNLYGKTDYQLTASVHTFIDLQFRQVHYKSDGTDKGGDTIAIDKDYSFFNPKVGLTFNLPQIGSLYASYAIANREPVRTDFLDAPEGIIPEPENMQDIEAGLRKSNGSIFYCINGYAMIYTNQLALTGEINDVGSPIRANVGKSHRIGIEIDGGGSLASFLSLRANLALSKNRTDYRQWEETDSVIISYDDVPLAFSPGIVGGFEVTFIPIKDLEIAFVGKYVGRQYLDLTGNNEKSLNPYFVNNIRIGYSFKTKLIEQTSLSLQINNLFNSKYASYGYVDSETPYFFPQAGTNMLAGISIQF
jgi:iron complex outermembrane recepter protein